MFWRRAVRAWLDFSTYYRQYADVVLGRKPRSHNYLCRFVTRDGEKCELSVFVLVPQLTLSFSQYGKGIVANGRENVAGDLR